MERTEVVSGSTARMRRHRERAKSGKVFVEFEMAPDAIARLVELGWLREAERGNKDAVISAFLKFGAKALWG